MSVVCLFELAQVRFNWNFLWLSQLRVLRVTLVVCVGFDRMREALFELSPAVHLYVSAPQVRIRRDHLTEPEERLGKLTSKLRKVVYVDTVDLRRDRSDHTVLDRLLQ